MAELFLKILNMSITAGWIVLAVLLLRILLKKASKWIRLLLWGVVGIRLICPISFESIISLIPSAETISPEIMLDAAPKIDSGIPIVNNAVNSVISGSLTPEPAVSVNPLQILIPILAIAWLVGIAVMLIYTVISFLSIKRKVETAVLLRDNIYQSEAVISPFVLGFIKPKIYLPFGMSGEASEYVIAHEEAHIRRKDHIWKPLGFLLLTIYWFNPLIWVGYIFFCRDIELACDEKVVSEFSSEQKADYSQALLTLSVNRRTVAACPIAFGETGVKGRVKSVLNYKKPAFWVIITAIILSAVLAACFLTNPASNKLKNIENRALETSVLKTGAVLVSDGEEYKYVGVISEELLNEICNIKISRREVSLDRSEDRDKTNTIVLKTASGEEVMLSYANSEYLHFSSDFSSVWLNDGVKPTLSYSVKNPDKAKEIYEKIANYNLDEQEENYDFSNVPNLNVSYNGRNIQARRGGINWTYSLGQDKTHTISSKKQNFINYVNFPQELPINIAKAEGEPLDIELRFQVKPDNIKVNAFFYAEENKAKPFDVAVEGSNIDLSNIKGTNGRYFFEVIATWNNAKEYSGEVQYAFFSNVYSVEDKGIKEIIDRTLTEGLDTSQAIEPFYTDENFVYSFGSIKSQHVIVKFNNGEEMNVKDALDLGLITISDLDKWNIGYLKQEKVKEYIEEAIERVLKEKYKAEKPDGLVHSQFYTTLAKREASGTPMIGETEHTKIETAYIIACAMTFRVTDNGLEEVSCSIVPTIMTFSVDKNGYTLKEYWTAEKGESTEKEIRERFPEDVVEFALKPESQKDTLKKYCLLKAEGH